MVFLPNQPKIVEPESMFKHAPTSSITARETVKVLPANGTSFSAGQQITIEFPAVQQLDVANSYLSYKIKTTAGKLVTNNSQAWISRARLSDGRSTVIFDIQNYNKLNGIMELLMAHAQYRTNVGDILEGCNTDTVTTAQRRCCQILGGVLDNNSQFFPLKYTQGAILDLWVESLANATTDGATALTISDVSYVCEFVTLDQAYTAGFEQAFLTTGIKYNMDSYTTSQTTINSSSVNKQITESIKSLKSVYAIQQQADDNIDVYRQARLKTVQFKYANRYHPAQSLSGEDGASEILKETMKAVNLSGDVSWDINLKKAEWTDAADDDDDGQKFIIGMNFEKSPNSAQSGQDVTRAPLTVALTYNTTGDATAKNKSPNAVPITLTTFCHYDQLLVFSSNGTQVFY